MRFLSSPPLRIISALRILTRRPISTTTTNKPLPLPPDPNLPKPRSRTPLQNQFESWIQNLKPGFTQSDVDVALRSQPDPDLSLDIFHWTAQQRHYKHDHTTYLTMIQIAISGKRYSAAETLIEEVIAGACTESLPLFNTMVKFCSNRRPLFNRAFDIYKKMMKSEDAKPDLETYTMLFNSLLRKFDKLNVCYGYLPAVRSLAKQMKASGVIPDTFVLNMIIKAYSKSRDMEDALRVFGEMRLYNCEPNSYTYSYIAQGLCEKGRVSRGFEFFKEMREKELVPKVSAYLIVICSLVMERRFEDAVDVMYDMFGNSLSPDLLTYQTLLEEMCRDGRGDAAFELLEECKKRDKAMNEKTYRTLLDGLHFTSQDL